MAYLCDNCKYIFPNKRSSCPFCGGRVYNNTLLEKNLLNDGYMQAPVKVPKGNQQNHVKPENSYDDLRHAFFSAQKTESSKSKVPEEMSHRTSEGLSKDDNGVPYGTDYFSQFSRTLNNENNIPTVEAPTQTQQSDHSSQNDPYEQELQELERQRRRLDRQHRRRSALYFISNIRWRAVFRILFVILLIVIAVTIWQMRYVIFNSIINFIVGLLPIVIIVWIMWNIFRFFFGDYKH